ncbi:MAG TPA: polynucleotide adenylyltransferase PcnB [Thermoanaerobaculia bacterium]|nr:polynucleotide adenylyltransferase PcnB [Thermoanaerobaculia bacterium]
MGPSSVSGFRKDGVLFRSSRRKSKHPFCQCLRLEFRPSRDDREAYLINDTRTPPEALLAPDPTPEPAPRIRPRSEHPISRSKIDPDALKVLYRLQGAGHKGYLVGGSVRDLLLSRVPKDFDIGTDAHPQALRRLFRNCRLIGRRFRLAHILFANGKVVEVATFRRRPDPVLDAEGQELLQTSDNTFGTPREDALRRDFTINGLFYDIASLSVIDYVGGLEDLEAGLVRTIGDPDIRFQEDPVRMMRAVEFASRLGFAITPDSYEAILRHRKEIVKSAPPRVTEELAQSLRGGHALPTWLLMREVGLLDVLLPELAAVLRQLDPDHAGGTGHLFWALLDVLDAERRRGRAFEDAVLFALVCLPIARARVRDAAPDGEPDPNRLAVILEEVVAPLALRMAWPRAVAERIKLGLAIIGRLSHRPDAKIPTRRLAMRDAFPTALDLFELTAMATGRGLELVADWRGLQARVARARETGELPPPPPPAPRRRRRGGRGRGKRVQP